MVGMAHMLQPNTATSQFYISFGPIRWYGRYGPHVATQHCHFSVLHLVRTHPLVWSVWPTCCNPTLPLLSSTSRSDPSAGMVGMAHMLQPNTATSQFYISF